jgi:hydroxymethylbilane synthase
MGQLGRQPLIRIGSRGSQLALWQARHIAAALRGLGHEVAIEVIRTTGDRMQSMAFAAVGSKGMFTREIEEALVAGTIDLAVHSLKDLPTELDKAFTLAAIPPRADARDVFVSQQYERLPALPPGSRVGTSSLRRQAQLRALRPDLEYIEFRGNVDTRLAKLADGKADAIILAAAGLDRLEKADVIRERFSPEVLCPSPGQGALGIECRAGDERMLAVLAKLDDRATRLAVTAERTCLAALGGGCLVPIGAYCHSDGAIFHLRAVVASPDGRELIAAEHRHTNPVQLGEETAQQLLAQGAGSILGLEEKPA